MAAARKSSSGETEIKYCCFQNSQIWRSNQKSIHLRSYESEKCLCNAKLRSIPAVDYNLAFSNQKCSRMYGDAALFGVKFFGMDELITQFNITPSDYKTYYPLFTFDVIKQKKTQILCC